jgi:membrane-associated HD superfamily phosphohydrolase
VLLWATRLALLAAAISAVALAWRRADHRTLAAFFGWLVGIEILRSVLNQRYGLIRPLGSPPFTGAACVATHVNQAIELSWSAGIAIVVLLAFQQRRWLAALVILSWAGAVAYLATHYPEIRGNALAQVYLAAELIAIAIAAASIITWTWRREPPTPARIGILCVCVADVVTLIAGAYAWGFWMHWDLNQIAFALTYATIAVYQVHAWRLLSSPSSSR